MPMRTPFIRPTLSIVFYVLAALVFLTYTLLGLGALVATDAQTQKAFPAVAGAMGLLGLGAISGGVFTGALLAAIGYVIELLAKIEWNTRPNTDEMGYVVEPARGPTGSSPDKQYYLSEKGRVTGPLNAAELLALYRDGRISIAAQISVDENGQRRLLKNLSEIGL